MRGHNKKGRLFVLTAGALLADLGNCRANHMSGV
jgi:hypothetical protein